MLATNWWFAPVKIGDGKELLPNATKYSDRESKIENASALSVYLRGVYVNKSLDKNWKRKPTGTNDLLILTNFQVGTQPIVQVFHYYKEKQKTKEFVGNFFNTRICSFEDFKDKHLTLQIRVYDVDRYDNLKNFLAMITQGVNENAAQITQAFPAIASYIPFASAATSMINLIDELNRDDLIMESQPNLRLEITNPREGSNLLQSGHWICFDEPQEKGVKLDSNLRISGKFKDCNYAIFSIKKEKADEPNWILNQKIATLLTELKANEEGKGREKSAIDFLRDTMRGYVNYNKITRYQELKTKKDQRDKKVKEKMDKDKKTKPSVMIADYDDEFRDIFSNEEQRRFADLAEELEKNEILKAITKNS